MLTALFCQIQMPAPVRKLLVVDAPDGLVLQPTAGTAAKPRTPSNNNHALVLAYGDGRISSRLQAGRLESAKHHVLEVHGVVGTTTSGNRL